MWVGGRVGVCAYAIAARGITGDPVNSREDG